MILEPATDGRVISFFDVHMVTAPFSPSADGETHLCSDWQIDSLPSMEIVWQASCARGVSSVHIHLGDGQFVNSMAGARQLRPDTDYRLRVRFQVRSASGETEVSNWAERLFHTSKASDLQPLLLQDAAQIRKPSWTDESSQPIAPPADDSLTLLVEAVGAGTILEFHVAGGEPGRVVNPAALASHGPARVSLRSGSLETVALPASRIRFADGGARDCTLYLPELDVAPGQTLFFWIADNGGSFAADGSSVLPSFSLLARQAPIPWAVRQPGFEVVPVATGFQLPVNIAFVPRPGPRPLDPLFYVTELYGNIKVVTRSREVRDYATGLLDFDPVASFPGSGERGLAGIVIEPETGDLFASLVSESPPGSGTHHPKVIRLHSADAGLTASSRSTVLDMPNDPVGPSHQISNLSIGPDGKLYVHVGDGFDTAASQSLASFRGKVLRVNLDGTPPADNPFFNAARGVGAADYVYAYGFRNPFGGAWRSADGSHYEVESGPFVDRFARVVAGRNYLWDGSDTSMSNYAIYNWTSANSPVNIAFVQPENFGGSGFPSDKMGHAFVTESGPTYAFGPQANGKRISEFVLDEEGNLAGGPQPLIEYDGAGRASAVGLTAGPDGLYFSDLYKDVGAALPYDRGANIFRIRHVGVADFSAANPTGPGPLPVRFQEESRVPHPVSWRWEFGDGWTSSERNPVHVYVEPGTYDVRLTVALADGQAVAQKNDFVLVQPGTHTGLPHVPIGPCAGNGDDEAFETGAPALQRPCGTKRIPLKP